MSERALRAGIIVLGLPNLVVGVLLMVAPDWFFDNIGPYGVENSHYMGDVGAVTIAVALGLLIAVVRPSWRVPLLIVTAIWLGLHAVNHLFDIDENNRSDARGTSDTILLAIGAIAAALLARESSEHPVRPPAAQRPRDYPPGD
jgi:hypothetical protein